MTWGAREGPWEEVCMYNRGGGVVVRVRAR